MWGWAKAAGIAAASVMLMGSKLVIEVPAGGAVVSSSGLFACSAGETCTIEIDPRHFAETFTAVPAPGYDFARWRDQAGAVCGGSHDPSCSELDTGPFSDFEGTSILHGDSTLSLSPSFSTSYHVPPAPGAAFSVRSHHSTRYYEVGGETREELWARLTGDGNPLAFDHQAGSKPLGHASFHYQYHYQSAYGASPASCRVASGAIEFRFETVLPRLAEGETLGEPLKRRWLPFERAITEHEAGHHAIYRELLERIPRALAELGETPCNTLEQQVRLAVSDVVGEVRRASAAYDRNQGDEHYVASSL